VAEKMQRQIERRRMIEKEIDKFGCCSLRSREVHQLTIAARMIAEKQPKNKAQERLQSKAITHIINAIKCVCDAQTGGGD
jgi:hypothetical protein